MKVYTSSTATVKINDWTIATQSPKFKPEFNRDVLHELKLAWWRIGNYDKHDGGVNYQYQKKGYLGLTVCSMSDIELGAIRLFARNNPRAHLTKRETYTGGFDWATKFIGNFEDYCINMWAEDSDTLAAFVGLLEGFRARTRVIKIKNVEAAKQFVKKTNFKILRGDRATVLGLTDEIDDHDYTLLRMAAT